MSAEVSHGRGGAGNFKVDDTQYVDGEVVRTGVEGSHGDGAFSSGRGGAGNISDVGSKPSERRYKDIIPEAAVRPSQDGRDYHTGRGGAGNAQTATPERKSEEKLVDGKAAIVAPVGLADKLKAKIFGSFKK
ncbi:GTP1 OBG domain-containing [Fusarium albosuccineum]|uniref:GTP1 OBG domain-containing n=1 Tax=Fusarium albosuccineum TaxID=1237068 RepID=A0A8H4L8Z9_9HYPO|nr:GTP1 OBG domain-containing [Fusarium albosuccineum]